MLPEEPAAACTDLALVTNKSHKSTSGHGLQYTADQGQQKGFESTSQAS